MLNTIITALRGDSSVLQRDRSGFEHTHEDEQQVNIIQNALVMMEKYDDKQKNFSDGKIAVPIKLTESGMTLLENQSNIAYVLFHSRKKEKNKHFFRVESIVRVLSKDDAEKEGYYFVQSTAKLK